MSSQGGTDWVGAAAGGVMLVALLICGGAFIFSPQQRPAAAAAQQQVRAPNVQEERDRAEKEKAERDEAQAYASAKEAVQSVRYSLADPSSAMFKDVWAVRGQIADAPKTVFACGTVNAKNGFGGYVGYMPFVAVGSTVLTPQDGIFESVFRQVCLGGEKLFAVEV